MRLWSFSPSYLDSVGLNRAINEAISGYKALTGQQKMWANHSQLIRFKEFEMPEAVLSWYIDELLQQYIYRKKKEINFREDETRNYVPVLKVTIGQLKYEWQRYLNKLKTQKGRDKQLYEQLKDIEIPDCHPLFSVVDGDVESWEKVK